VARRREMSWACAKGRPLRLGEGRLPVRPSPVPGTTPKLRVAINLDYLRSFLALRTFSQNWGNMA
jgi:hypothetical protein